MDAASVAERLEHSDGGALFHKTYRHLCEGEKRQQANKLERFVPKELDDEGTTDGEATREGHNQAVLEDGRYWARTSRADIPRSADLGRNRRVCRYFSEGRGGPISVLSNFLRLLVWSLRGQRALLVE